MIVRPKPGPLAVLFAIRGSILPQIAPRVAGIALLSLAVAFAARWWPGHTPDLGVSPFALLGIVLSIFLGFRNSACYDRWWEARKQWGELIVELRCLARDATTLLHDPAIAERVVRAGVGFAQALALRLRGRPQAAALAWLPEASRAGLAGRVNLPQAILQGVGLELANCVRTGTLSDMLYQPFSARLAALTAVQTACERIANTPVPFAYTLLVHRTAMLFCLLLPFGLVGALGMATPLVTAILAYAFFGLDALGTELEAPFETTANGLALDAMVRTAEIDLLEALGVAELPQPLQPAGFRLS